MPEEKKPSIVVLTSRGFVHYALIHSLSEQFHVAGVLFESQRGLGARLLLRRLRRLGALTVLDQLLFKVLDVIRFQPRANREAERLFGGKAKPLEPVDDSGRVMDAISVNSPEVRAWINGLSPDLIVLSGTSLLDGEFLRSLGSVPVINIHCGITPRYRGNHGAFWAVVNGDWENAGTTIHFVDETIDGGAAILQGTIKPELHDSPRDLALKQYALGIDLMVRAVSHIAAGDLTTVSRRDLDSRLYSSPTLTAYLTYRRNLRKRFSAD